MPDWNAKVVFSGWVPDRGYVSKAMTLREAQSMASKCPHSRVTLNSSSASPTHVQTDRFRDAATHAAGHLDRRAAMRKLCGR